MFYLDIWLLFDTYDYDNFERTFCNLVCKCPWFSCFRLQTMDRQIHVLLFMPMDHHVPIFLKSTAFSTEKSCNPALKQVNRCMFILANILLIVSLHLILIMYTPTGCGANRIIELYKIKIKPALKSKHNDHNILEGRAQDPASNSVDFENIRLYFDTSQIESDWAGYSRLSFFVDDVIPAAERWLEKVIKVRPGNALPYTYIIYHILALKIYCTLFIFIGNLQLMEI